MIDLVTLKTSMLNELKQQNHAELVESWKQANRDKKSEILKNRQRLMDELISSANFPLNHPKSEKIEFVQMAVLTELRNLFKNEILEAWREKEVIQKSTQLACHHKLMNDIREKPRLRKRHLSYNEARNAVICDLKRRHSDCQVVPEWKEKQMAYDREILAVRNQVLQDVVCKNQLKSDNFMSKRAKLMEEIRKNNPVEQWRQDFRDSKFSPIISKKLVLDQIQNDGLFKRMDLKSVAKVDFREKLLAEIRKDPIPEWKEDKVRQMSESLRLKKLVNNEILEGCDLKSKMPGRHELMREIRKAGDLGEIEGWKQKIREQRADALFGKHSMVAVLNLEGVTTKLPKTPRKIRKSGPEVKNLLSEIRTEPLEAWKEARNLARRNVFINKSEVNREIENLVFLNLKSDKNVVSVKTECMKEIRRVTDSPIPKWREDRDKCKVEQLGKKLVMQEELRNDVDLKSALKSVKSDFEKRIDLLRDLRTERIPSWKEDERNEKVKVQVAKVMVNAEIMKHKK